MEIGVSDDAGVRILSVSGEVDLQTSPRLREAILAAFADSQSVIVDLSQVAYMDSSAVASLVEGYQAAKAKGGTMRLAQVSDMAMRVLKLARLDQVFEIFETVDDAKSA